MQPPDIIGLNTWVGLEGCIVHPVSGTLKALRGTGPNRARGGAALTARFRCLMPGVRGWNPW